VKAVSFKSLGWRTTQIFRSFSGTVEDRGLYTVIRTPSRPGFFWGNCVIMKNPPAEGDLNRWIEIFESEIGPAKKTGFMAIGWDDPDGSEGLLTPFLEFGFRLSRSTILTAASVVNPPKYNEHLVIRPLVTDQDWNEYEEIHFDPNWDYGSEEGQRKFLRNEAAELRAMVQAGIGIRFGAFLEGKAIAELGIYWDGEVARFNNVGTHRDYRRLGACGTLVHHASQYALTQVKCRTLVMEADSEYHAARIYESLGFKPTQKSCELEWFDSAMLK
jgi:hypothetical protein